MKKINAKQLFNLLLMFTVLIMSASCKKKTPPEDEPKVDIWTQNEKSAIVDYLQTKIKAPTETAISGELGGTISQDGISVTFPANLFAKANGDLHLGMVKLKLYTMTNVKDMIYARGSTISPRGDLLLSSGMFKIEAMDSLNNNLKVQSGKSYTAEINVPNNPLDSIFKGRISNTDGNQIVWDVWPDASAKRGQNSTSISGLNDFSWCNLDRYMNENPLTNIYITLPAGFTSANSDVIFKYTGEMSSAFLPANSTLKQFTTDGSYYKVVQGRSAKIMAIAKKDNKFYYFTISIASINANHSEVITTMTETTEVDFNSQIANF